jgi:acyl-coenzyme A synthetase/AMP-(fatty) acid ligase
MKIIKDGVVCDLTSRIKYAESKLLSEKIYILDSDYHEDHIAAYLAWKSVGGNIFIRSSLLPKEQCEFLNKEIKKLNVSNSIMMHTSGTTGFPKIVINHERQIAQAIKMSTSVLGWGKDTKFLNFLPPFTSGFWHIVLPEIIHHNCELILGNKNNIADSFDLNVNLTVLVPALVDLINARKIPVNFDKFQKLLLGGAQVLNRHAEFIFNNSARSLVHAYGTTEICSPILCRETNHKDDFVEYIELSPHADAKSKLVNGELYIAGDSLCSNYTDFKHEDEWFITSDIWEQKDNLIKFVGRSNEIIKINGYQCSLLLVEKIAEEKTNLGESLAVLRNSIGTDWVELYYTNKNEINVKELKEIFKDFLVPCNIPRKYTYIDQLPRNGLGKKIRNVL